MIMANNTNQLILNSLDEIKTDIKEIKTDIKELEKNNTDISIIIAKIETSLTWIKILFPITFALIIFLLGVLIMFISKLS